MSKLFFVLLTAFFASYMFNFIPNYATFNNESQRVESKLSATFTKDSYQFMNIRAEIDANNAILRIRKDENLIEDQLSIILDIIDSSVVSKRILNNRSNYKDDFRGWISYRNSTRFQEVPLYESYVFFSICEFLYVTKVNQWNLESQENMTIWNKILTFVEKDVWTKWYSRSEGIYGNNYSVLLRNRTHMGAHWAGIALYLYEVSSKVDLKLQYRTLINQYNLLLKRNFKNNDGGFIWNSTYDNTKGTWAIASSSSIIQDVDHGNHVVSYIVAAYEMGDHNWKIGDIDKLAKTLEIFIYDPANNKFKDNVDGSKDIVRPGWGNFVSDGWVKLSKYSPGIKEIMKKYLKSPYFLRFNYREQFESHLSQ